MPLLLAACAPKPVATASTPPTQTAALDPHACAAQGGTIRPVCRMQKPMCVIAYADAGKACRSDADCAGKCRAPDEAVTGRPTAGICQASSDPCGCSADVVNGITGTRICRD